MLLKRYITAAALVLLLLGFFGAFAAGTPGSAGDPVISLSYIENTFIPYIMNEVEIRLQGKFEDQYEKALSDIEELATENITVDSNRAENYVKYIGYMKTVNTGLYINTDRAVTLKLKAGERLIVSCGSMFAVTSGRARIEGSAVAEVINVTAGSIININTPAASRASYMLTNDEITAVEAVSDITVSVQGRYQIIPEYMIVNTDLALVLKDLGLFLGSNKGFELGREATRLEALIIFIRIIGEEAEALRHTTVHPYGDVPKWADDLADRYVAYAYDKGYTKGISASAFGASNPVTAEQYMTFILRAMGYTEGTDFTWLEALNKSVQLGILTEYERDMISRTGFYRDTAVYVSYYSLLSSTKDYNASLIEVLVDKGIISYAQAESAAEAKRTDRK